MKITNKKGFTILELMIASTIFSVILLLCTFGIVQIGKTYYKGTTVSRTQSVARDVMDRLTQEIQFSSSVPRNPSPISADAIVGAAESEGRFCVGSNRYTFRKNTRVDSGANPDPAHALVVDSYGGGLCSNAGFSAAISNKGKELLGEGMRLGEFEIISDLRGYTIKLRVIQGGDDLIKADGKNCEGGAGSQFCGSSFLETTVRRRLSN